MLGIMQGALDLAYVRAALLEAVGEDDYRTKKWDELVAQLVSASLHRQSRPGTLRISVA
ncbi:MAG: hypothetical protein Q8K32_35765 [Archangium sp.]|nr:hypothetical protein [Archangium sp.]